MEMKEYVQCKGMTFCVQGKPILLRGMGIGSWLNMEHFMIGLPGSDEMIQKTFCEVYGREAGERLLKHFRDCFVQEEDFAFLKSCGVNFLRIPFNYRLFCDDQNVELEKEEGFVYFDRILSYATKYQIYIMPDLHTTPGGQNPDWHADNSYGVPLFWKYQIFQKQMCALWKRIAARYVNEPFLFGYDVINEPAMAGWEHINGFYEEVIHAIREVDENHIIVLEGDMFSMDFEGLKLALDDNNIALGFHYYPTVWHTELLDSNVTRQERKEQIAEGLDRLLYQLSVFGCPVLCGEFGYGIDCGDEPLRTELLVDTLSIMEERELSWCLWAYKDAHFMSLVSPSDQGAWMKLVRKIGAHWSQDIEKEQAASLLNLLQQSYPDMTDGDRYLLQFRFRSCFYMLQQKYVTRPLLEEMSYEEMKSAIREYCFADCEINESMKRSICERLCKQ